MNTVKIALAVLTFEEEFKEVPYYCSQGYPTVGIGQRIGPKGESLEKYEFTVPLKVAQAWVQETIQDVNQKLSSYSFYTVCNADRQAILVSITKKDEKTFVSPHPLCLINACRYLKLLLLRYTPIFCLPLPCLFLTQSK